MKMRRDGQRFPTKISKDDYQQIETKNNNLLPDSKLIAFLASLSAFYCSIYAVLSFYGNTTPYEDNVEYLLILFGILILILTIYCGIYLESLFNEKNVIYSSEELKCKYISSFLKYYPFVIFFVLLGIVIISSPISNLTVSPVLFIALSTPFICFTTQIFILKKNQFRKTNDKNYFRGKIIFLFALSISISLTLITTFLKSIIKGVDAGIIIPFGWTTTIILFYFGGLTTPKLAIIKNMKSKINFPQGFAILMSITFFISILFMGIVVKIMNETSLKIDKSSFNYDRSDEYHYVQITVVNEGGKYASGEISLAIQNPYNGESNLIIVDSTDRIDGFGKWEVSFHIDNPDGKSLILLYNKEEKDNIVIYTGCADVISITFTMFIAMVMKRRKFL